MVGTAAPTGNEALLNHWNGGSGNRSDSGAESRAVEGIGPFQGDFGMAP